MKSEPLINILTRSHRPRKLGACEHSVSVQTYQNYHHWIYHSSLMPGFAYNLLCNNLKSMVKDGWFFFLDDDDVLVDPSALSRIASHLYDCDVAVICQFLRAGKPKPSDALIDSKSIVRGKIGMPCIFLHAKWKDLVDFGDTEDADYLFIKAVSERLPVKFVKEVIVNSERRNYGR